MCKIWGVKKHTAGWYYFARVLVRTFFGTGSYPCVPQGWHRAIRFKPSHIPLGAPHSRMASIVYWEHEGVCLQCVPSSGESVSWYSRIGAMKIF